MGKTPLESGPTALPLVSVLIINWNYAAYIGRTIDSVKRQSYANLDVVILDNGSTDSSRQIVAEHIANDPRFRLVRRTTNLGQLGAFFDVYQQLRGEFIVNLDADDMLFPDFIATHVQAHLALGAVIGFTSSDVTIIGKDDEVLLHGYRARSRERPDTTGFASLGKIPRIAQVNEEAYRQLNDTVSTHHGPVGWIWGPGTSNMYRRSALDMIYEHPKQRAWMRASDSFLNPLCHAISGTALINQELSAYRVHGANYYTSVRIAAGGRRDRATQERQLKDFYETTDSLLRRARHYTPLLGDRYWEVLRCLAKFIARTTGTIMPGSPDTIALLSRNYDTLCAIFTKEIVLQQLPNFFIKGDIQHATGEISGRTVSPTNTGVSLRPPNTPTQ